MGTGIGHGLGAGPIPPKPPPSQEHPGCGERTPAGCPGTFIDVAAFQLAAYPRPRREHGHGSLCPGLAGRGVKVNAARASPLSTAGSSLSPGLWGETRVPLF